MEHMITIRKDDIAPGEGKYVPGELGKPTGIDVYRDASGAFTVFSSLCPHRHCNVEWSAEKKHWACPCHGSEFSPQGKLLKGPATEGLKKVSFTDEGDSLAIDA